LTIGFDIRCELEYTLEGQSEFLFNVHAAKNSHQTVVTESFGLDGPVSYTQYTNAETGNRFVRAGANGKRLRLTYATSLLVDHYLAPSASINEVPVAQLPNEVLAYVLPSRYCPSDRLVALSTRLFKDLPHGYSRIEAVCDWVHSRIHFIPGTSNGSTSADDVLVEGSGVCRDFAHLTIALLRALNVPARFVTGYDYGIDPSYGPTDFHAYVEAYLGDRWYIFDSTRLCPRTGLVRIGTGRDAADVAFSTIFGPTRYAGMKLEIEPLRTFDDQPYRVLDDPAMAVSTARLHESPSGSVVTVGSQTAG